VKQGPTEQRWEQPGAKPRVADAAEFMVNARD
jgi:hypothetical protein